MGSLQDEEASLKLAQLLQENEHGFSVLPRRDCPHISSDSFVITDLSWKPSDRMQCAECGTNDEVWVCLRCGWKACGRFIKGHMLEHASNQSSTSCMPVVAMSLADLSTWCFACDDYITHPKLEGPFRALHYAKFGRYPDAPFHS